MSIIYCGKSNNVPYYIKEADLNIYSIQELAYFIYNYSILISNNFITKNLITYIDRTLNLHRLSNDINEMYNKKANLADILTLILANSNFYNDEEIANFREGILKLLSYPETVYINNEGDMLFKLKKYEKAISKYNKIAKDSDEAKLKLAFCYAKLQFYEMGAKILGELYRKTKSLDILKQVYCCLKLNGTAEDIKNYEENIREELLAEWEFELVTKIIQVRRGDEMKEKESIFLMGSDRIRDSVQMLIKIWKEKYRYIG